jgi:hydrogenase maturation protease
MTDAAHTVVIGLGNPLMADDGIGLAALARLGREWDLGDGVELIDGGTWGMNLLPLLEEARDVVFLDAVRSGAAPGTVVELEGDALPRGLMLKLSPHQIDLREVLALLALRRTLPPRMIAFGIEPDVVDMSTSLSRTAEAALPDLLSRVAAYLTARGHRCRLREPAPCTS